MYIQGYIIWVYTHCIAMYVSGGRVTRWRTMTVYDSLKGQRRGFRLQLLSATLFLFLTYLANMNKNKDTPRYAVAVYIQTLKDSGFRNQNSWGFFFSGFAYNMLMPSVMNGVVKSTAFRRSKVIVRSQIARSARCSVPHNQRKW